MHELNCRLLTLCTAALTVATFELVGCERQPPAPAAVSASPASAQASVPSGDPYDVSKMDFTPGPAKLGTERHTGPFAAGDALSLDATLKPLGPDPVKEIRLDVKAQ